MTDWLGLLEAVGDDVTDREREVAELRASGRSITEIVKETGIHLRNVQRYGTNLKRKASAVGYSPEADARGRAPEGYRVKGKSTFYDADGVPIRTWVKTEADKETMARILIERLELGSTNFATYKPTKGPAQVDDDLLTLLTITDFHLGMYAWAAETGDDWDVDIARDTLLDAVQAMIKGSPKSKVGVLNQLGDFLHFDSLSAVTPMSGHLLDADTRYGKLVDLAIEVMTQTVKMMLARFEVVHVIQAEGNHDMAGSVWLRKHIKHVFKHEPRLTVDDSEFPYYAYLHGRTMLAFHHGHKMKLAQLHKLFASEPRFRAMWGNSDHTYIHAGHLHHEKVVEDGGAIAEQHPTLSSRDAFAARGGWVSMRGAKAITYHKLDGEVHRVTVRPKVSAKQCFNSELI
jgi:hypothetical protein